MKIEVVKYTNELYDVWNSFVEKSINGNFLHSRNFFDHNPLNKEDDYSLVFLKKGKIAAVLPCNIYESAGRKILHSHQRSTYGGFVVNTEIGVDEAIELVDKLIIESKKLGVDEIKVRNPFRIFNSRYCDETDYAMWYHGFSLLSREIEIVVDLNRDFSVIQKDYDNGTKYNIKKAVKNVEVKQTNDYKGFWEILENSLIERHGQKPVHNYEQFELLRTLVGNDKVKLFAGFVNDKIVCGVVVFLFSKKVIHAQYIGSDNQFQDLRPVNAVINHIICWGSAEGFQHFNLGSANEKAGRVINSGLFHFKEGFGGRGVLRETMHLILK